MCGLAHYFESEGLSTVLVGFVREHMKAIKPARGLFLDFPMGRGMGKPNDPEFQKKVIRAAFDLFDLETGPVLEDFPETIPVRDGRMGYALPPELVLKISDIGDIDALLAEVEAEMRVKTSIKEATKQKILLEAKATTQKRLFQSDSTAYFGKETVLEKVKVGVRRPQIQKKQTAIYAKHLKSQIGSW